MVRLLKPLDYYLKKYGTALYGLDKMYLLMEKQHNRGQDGVGLASIKFDVPIGSQYINIERSNSEVPIKDIFAEAFKPLRKTTVPNAHKDLEWIKNNMPFAGELMLGHLRYGTFGGNGVQNLHPFHRENNWKTRNLVIAGNFNLTNVDELFDKLISLGQHPTQTNDTITVLEKVGKFLDDENQRLFDKYKHEGIQSNVEISRLIAENLDITDILQKSAKHWDGGYAMAGLLGHGDAFVMRDPSGIRPVFYYHDDEIVVVTSERPVIQTALKVPIEQIHSLTPGHAIIIRKNGNVSIEEFRTPEPTPTPCSFERIYFSRGTDADIYNERKMLGELLAEPILKSCKYDVENTIFSYIPNTASVAFWGLCKSLEKHCKKLQQQAILENKDRLTPELLTEILDARPRVESIAVKDVKMRTFITQDAHRDDMVAHVYDITYGTVRAGVDSLVVLDDSIVRGTTLRQSILRMLDRLEPKKIIIASSAPQIRYPDCYGIDMSRLGEFVAFEAAIELLKDTNQEHIIKEVYEDCKAQLQRPKEEMQNAVRAIYKPFTQEQISKKIAQLLTPTDLKAEVEIVYQTIEGLHEACPNNHGDWYFTGKYPTPGGMKVVNKAFINYYEKKNERAY